MNSELIVKDVNFNGAILRAAQDADGKIWVGVRWICQGMGFDKERIDNERKKMQKDIVISQGVKFYSLGNSNANKNVLCVELNYIPLWLAKIAITPTMQRENPKMVEKLIDYQLRAKDVLAEAFLKDRVIKEDIVPAYKTQGNMIHLQLPDIQMPVIPDYSDKFVELNQKIDNLYSEMGKLAAVMIQGNNSLVKLNTNTKPNDISQDTQNNPVQNFQVWKKKIYISIDLLTKCYKFKDRAEVLKYIYNYMNHTYGIVWIQAKREYKERNSTVSKFSTLDVIYDDKQLLSIFECVLDDLCKKYKEYCKDQTELIIQPLVAKFNDTSNGYMHTYRKVYSRMNALDPNINWNSLEQRYIAKYGKLGVTKRKIVERNPELLKKFQKTVNIMLVEG